MKRIGEVKTITGSIAVVRGEDQTRPKIGTKVIDEKLEKLIHRVEYHKYFFKNFSFNLGNRLSLSQHFTD